ncbi:MAG TPA: hypothetical protein VNX25_00160 [Verrucomicrobiae bacterium]|nr:hypothetical protein [Verrucomicrobiae bacterium]
MRIPYRCSRLVLVAVLALALSGCFRHSTVVRVRRDGSGTVERTLLVNRDVLGRLKLTAEELVSLTDTPGFHVSFDFFDREGLARRGAGMGEGVTFLGGEPVSTPEGQGFRATYGFRDISRITVPLAGGSAGPSLRFSMQQGEQSTLLVRQDPPFASVRPVAPGEPDAPAGASFTLPAGMKFSVAVEVEGEVLASDARYRESGRISLVEIDSDRLLAAPPAEPLRLLLGAPLPGVLVDLSPEIRVVFR